MKKSNLHADIVNVIRGGARKPAQIHKAIGGDIKRSQIYAVLDTLRKSGAVVRGVGGYYVYDELPASGARKKATPNRMATKAKPNRMATKAKPNRMATKAKDTSKEDLAVLGREILKGRTAIDNLLQENQRLHNIIQEQENTITALKIDMLDQQAIINYLEKKLIK